MAYAGVEGVRGDGNAVKVVDGDCLEPVTGKIIHQKL